MHVVCLPMGSVYTPRVLTELCGNLIVGGFEGETLPSSFAQALREKKRAGAILFKRNLPTIEATKALCASIREQCDDIAPIIAIDEEGGRVGRLPPPYQRLPPMRAVAEKSTPEQLQQIGEELGKNLAEYGFNLDFAPVLDVDSNPNNPIIGDRSFGNTPDAVIEKALAFAKGLQKHVATCGKHFPGHGDTDLDSHLALPIIEHNLDRLNAIELPPFLAACPANVDSLMTAHIVVKALDPLVPATLSKTICTDLLRTKMGFTGVLFSDDLEMKAVADQYPVETSAVAAIEAGCDILLICRNESWQDRAFEALVRHAEKSEPFRARVEQAAARSRQLRSKFQKAVP